MSDGLSWRVREACADDAAALALVGAATFLETFAGILDGPAIVAHCAAQHSETTYRRSLRAGARAWLAEAQSGGAPIGLALLTTPDLAVASTGDIELKRIYALSRYHSSGLGGELMRCVVEAAAGHDRLLLGVYAGNHRAIAFYRKQGFTDLALRKFDVGGKLYDDRVMARPLAV